MKPSVNQCAFSIAGHFDGQWGRNDATVEMCRKHNITYEAYSPLGGWALGGTGRVLHDPVVNSIAAHHNKSSAQVALRWVVQQGIPVVTSSDKLEYDKEDLAIFDFELTSDDMARLAALQ